MRKHLTLKYYDKQCSETFSRKSTHKYNFSQFFKNVLTISLKFPEKIISETLASAGKVTAFIKFHIKNVTFSKCIYVKIMSEYTQECTKMHNN